MEPAYLVVLLLLIGGEGETFGRTKEGRQRDGEERRGETEEAHLEFKTEQHNTATQKDRLGSLGLDLEGLWS